MGNRIPRISKAKRNKRASAPEVIVPQIKQPIRGVKVRALYTYDIKNSDDLSFSKGDTLYVTSNLSDPWWLATHADTKKTGYIPSNYVVIDDGSPTSNEGYYEINHYEADKKLLLMGYKPGTYIIRPSSGMKM